ncbi:MAG: branched-chain amino acid ABC transporter permease [Lysobacterales bacterium]
MRFLFKTRYHDDVRLFRHSGQWFWYSVLIGALLLAPVMASDFYLGELALVFIWAIAGIGLMLLVGYTGLVSLGHAAFLAIGAYAHTWFITHGWPLPLALLKASLITAMFGALIGLPTMRMTGIYLAIATLAFAVIIEQIIVHWVTVTGGFRGLVVPRAEFLGLDLGGSMAFYYLCLGILIGCLLMALNLLRSPTGRAMTAVRDSEISAQSMGIQLARTKTVAFAISAGFTGLAGGLLAHKLGYLAPDAFSLLLSIQLLLMVVVGGLGSMHGVIFGAIFLGLLPQGIAMMRDVLPPAIAQVPGLEPGIFGAILILFLIFEPLGIHGRWLKIRRYFEMFPLYRKATYKRQKQFLRTERMR